MIVVKILIKIYPMKALNWWTITHGHVVLMKTLPQKYLFKDRVVTAQSMIEIDGYTQHLTIDIYKISK